MLEANFGKPVGGGGEAVVYRSDDRTVVKSIGLDYYGDDVQLAIDRILIHNFLFPNTALTDIGFGRGSDGTFRIIAAQPFVKGIPATREEIVGYAKVRGFQTDDNNIYRFNGFIVNDLNELNVIKTKEGNFAVIDAELRFGQEAPAFQRGDSGQDVSPNEALTEYIVGVLEGKGIKVNILSTEEMEKKISEL